MSDRTGGVVGNGDMIMALLGKDPEKTWKQANIGQVLKLPGDQLNAAVAQLAQWVKVDAATKSILLSERAGGFIGNGYWGGDKIRFDAAWKAVEDRTGGMIGNG